MANGASAMVFDQRVFMSLNLFNIYVSQPEVKPGRLETLELVHTRAEKLVTDNQESTANAA